MSLTSAEMMMEVFAFPEKHKLTYCILQISGLRESIHLDYVFNGCLEW